MKRYCCLFLILIVVPVWGEEIWPEQVDIFTDNAHPIQTPRSWQGQVPIQYFTLDAPMMLEEELSQGLPPDQSLAEQMARQRLATLQSSELQRRIQTAYAGLLKVLDYQLDRYPAVVFDQGQSVVYGVTDLAQALHRYRRWRMQDKE